MAKKISTRKDKKAYPILAPEDFDRKEIGTTVAEDPEMIKGRTVDKSLADLTGDRRKQHLKIIFEVVRVENGKAYTRFKKFYTPVGYLRYKIRKGNTKVELVSDMKFKGEKLRVKIMILTRYRVTDSRKKELLNITQKELENHQDKTPEKLLQLSLFGKLGTTIYKKCRKIGPINRVEVHQIERLQE